MLVGRYVMVLYTMVTSALIFKLCRNLGLRFPAAVASMLLWGLCPLVIFEARQVMLDNMATAWLLGAFVCATSRRQYLSRHLLAGVCFAVAILTKETTVILAPALLYALWTHCYKATRRFSVMASVLMTMLLVSIYPLFGLLKSELVSGPGHVSIQDALAFQLVSRTGSGSIFDPTSVAYDTVRSWLFYDQILLIAGLAAGVVCLALRNLRVIGLSLLILGVVALRPGGYLPLMYVIAVLPFAAVAVAGVGQWLFDQLARIRVGRAQAGRVVASVLALAAVVSVGIAVGDQERRRAHRPAQRLLLPGAALRGGEPRPELPDPRGRLVLEPAGRRGVEQRRLARRDLVLQARPRPGGPGE